MLEVSWNCAGSEIRLFQLHRNDCRWCKESLVIRCSCRCHVFLSTFQFYLGQMKFFCGLRIFCQTQRTFWTSNCVNEEDENFVARNRNGQKEELPIA